MNQPKNHADRASAFQRLKNPVLTFLPCAPTLVATPIIAMFLMMSSVWSIEPAGRAIQQGMIHLRNAEPREWTSFPQTAAATQLNLQFDATAQNDPGTLTLTQADVKESWTITLNKQPLGKLVRDENRLQTDFLIPAGLLKTGQNTLTIACRENAPADDILVGQIAIHPSPPESLRGAATLQVAITDQNQTPIPGRITLTNEHDILMPVGNQSGNHLAIREGVIYTATGEAVLGVAPGTYRITAGRGFEYSAPSTVVRIAAGETVKRTLMLERQVDTSGWIASDTHVHTVTYSGHGDCTIEERMATLAGEGIEFPIATDHNRQIDYQPVAETAGVTEHFTPVVGNEVTTKHGHFNVFPAVADGKLPDHNQLEWSKLFDDIYTQDRTRVAILNHARDLHSSFRPFSPRHHLSLTGDNLDGWQQEFNAMELINSGAVQTDPMELFLDWCGLINHGLNVTPVGCSDSHDVSRYIVGQARTYIKVDDRVPGNINVKKAIDSFLAGRVIVSYGILVKLEVKTSDPNVRHGPGDLVHFNTENGVGAQKMVVVTASVMAPEWATPNELRLFLNGQTKFSVDLRNQRRNNAPMSATVTWNIPISEIPHDAWITAVATGDGIKSPHWPTAKPYQPDSPTFQPHTFSCTGPIRLDIDGNGSFDAARDYAAKLLAETPVDMATNQPDLQHLARSLAQYDEAVVHQTLAILASKGIEPSHLISSGVGKRGRAFERQWRLATQARIEQRE